MKLWSAIEVPADRAQYHHHHCRTLSRGMNPSTLSGGQVTIAQVDYINAHEPWNTPPARNAVCAMSPRVAERLLHLFPLQPRPCLLQADQILLPAVTCHDTLAPDPRPAI